MGLCSHLALPAIEILVADMFTSILHYGYMPSWLRDCILVPIPKGNSDSTSSDNYRPIVLHLLSETPRVAQLFSAFHNF